MGLAGHVINHNLLFRAASYVQEQDVFVCIVLRGPRRVLLFVFLGASYCVGVSSHIEELRLHAQLALHVFADASRRVSVVNVQRVAYAGLVGVVFGNEF